jgi:hypothetical protein
MAFYMALPCTASRETYPDNRIGKYTTVLARPLELEGAWEVGLSEIILPQITTNLEKDASIEFYDRDSAKFSKDGEQLPSSFIIPAGRYATVHEITKMINAAAPQCKNSQKLCWNLSVKDGCTQLVVQDWAWLWFKSEELCAILGMSSRKPYWVGNYDFRSGYKLQLVYVYCDIIEHTVVGDELVPCLRTIPISIENSEQTWIRFENPHYITLQKNDFSTIEIEFADDRGETVKFMNGLSLMKLHFRPRKR